MEESLTAQSEYRALRDRLLSTVGAGSLSDAQFDSLALDLFDFQYRHGAVYRAYCRSAGATPSPTTWAHIPALPTAAYKAAVVYCLSGEPPLHFRTSGTTDSESGRHYFSSLDIYETVIMPGFRSHVLRGLDDALMLILTPPKAESPHSSLVHMMDTVMRLHGRPGSGHFVSGNTLDTPGFAKAIQEARRASVPVLLMGTAFALLQAMESSPAALGANAIRLPPGSRIMETGGFKGRTREVARAEFHAMLAGHFGVDAASIINEYGMTELSSQFYDRSLEDGVATDLKWSPPWTRVLIVDPMTGREMPRGEPGIVQIVDLANVASCGFLRTEDMGVMMPDGAFRVLGRAARAPVRGCSLDAESLRV